MSTDAKVLDPCSASRMMWFDKQDQRALLDNIHDEERPLCDGACLRWSRMRAKYGVLTSDWREGIRQCFAECFRVLEPEGALIFKWAETQELMCEKTLLDHLHETPCLTPPSQLTATASPCAAF